MILLNSFCPNCSIWLIPILLGAWLLGWWFWSLVKGSGYRNTIAQLNGNVDKLNKKNTDLETEMAQVRYEREKVEADYGSLRSKHGDLEIKLAAMNEQLQAAKSGDVDTSAWDTKIANLEGELATVNETAATDATNYQARIAELEAQLAAAATAGAGVATATGIANMDAPTETKSGFAAVFAEDDLKVVEGIGPKIEGLLKDGGIKTWSDLAGTETERLQQILSDAGPRYQMHDPGTWSKQAELAAGGQWDELIKYQKFLGGGKEDANIAGGDSKVEKLYAKAMGFKSFSPDDLKVVEGIGPKIEGLLKEGGINSWTALSQAKTADIQAILDAAGPSFKLADPGTWSKQAELAVNGEWDALKEYQDFLQGGKE